MSVSYWVAKYVEDPFRNEPRNVGVIVSQDGTLAGKFVGERGDGVFDRRKLGMFSHPDVYSQWRDYWRGRLTPDGIKELVRASTANFFVEPGGEVSDTSPDNTGDVCSFLFELVVGDGPTAAFDWGTADDETTALASEIYQAFEDIHVLPKSNDLLVRHPVVKNAQVAGKRITHTPSYCQRNGHLGVFEYIDLSSKNINKTKERAGWMAYMYADIRSAEQNAETVSIYRPEINAVDQVNYAKQLLGVESKLVNWSDVRERNEFLDMRRQTAAVA